MAEVQHAERKMSNEYMQHLNTLLTRNGFAPQQQGVVIDWDGLDAALKAHYLVLFEADRIKVQIATRKRNSPPKK